ncbi:unnamed protein product [Durusdinium trenchii]|uniref:Uncharacterized protein n=2 Tax=Durusdinium trenchii TaxID=1381693 RepID=A0ABP0NW15_9DINO
MRHGLYNGLVVDEAQDGLHGHYVLKVEGEEVCGMQVMGTQPWRLVLGAAWAADGHEASLAYLAEQLRRRAGRSGCSLIYDSRDERSAKLWHSEALRHFGLFRRKRAPRIAVTGVPVGLSEEQQARLARAPFLIPWEFLPFHSGRVVLI